jgi:hypothetical protein
MMSPSVLLVWNFLTRAWSGVGPLVGVLIGAWLSRSWQQRHWARDNRKAEYRELINCLSQNAHLLMRSLGPSVGGLTDEELWGNDGAASRGYNVISDRLFIAEVMKRENVRDRWLSLVKQREASKFWSEWSDLYKTLLETARRDLNLTE